MDVQTGGLGKVVSVQAAGCAAPRTPCPPGMVRTASARDAWPSARRPSRHLPRPRRGAAVAVLSTVWVQGRRVAAVGIVLAGLFALTAGLLQTSAGAAPSTSVPGATDRWVLVGETPHAAAAAAVASDAGGAVIDRFTVGDLHLTVVTGDGAVVRTAAAAGLRAHRDVTVSRAGVLRPNDPGYDVEAGVRHGSERLWAAGTGAGTVVAVLDTGVSPTADLPASRILAGFDATDDGRATSADVDPDRHGSLVAEVAAGSGNNALAGAGGCWDCAILPVRVLGADGYGWMSWVLKGIGYALDADADLVNLSLSSPAPFFPLRQIGAAAADQGVPLLAAAGNTGGTGSRYPAAYPEYVAVGGVDTQGRLHGQSQRGPWVQLTAPFCAAVTGAPRQFCGTSAATPFVAGHTASLISAGVDAPGAVALLADTAEPVHAAHVGGGRLDAAAALDRLALDPPAPHRPPQPLPALHRLAAPCADAPALITVIGGDRYETAAMLADRGGSAGTVVAVGARPPIDGLAAAAAIAGDVTVLLADADGLPATTRRVLDRLEVTDAVVAGGPAAVGEDTAAWLAGLLNRQPARIAGADRTATAAAFAAERRGGTVHLVDGRDLPAAATAAGVAAATGGVLLLTDGEDLAAADGALRRLRPDEVVLHSPVAAATVAAAHPDLPTSLFDPAGLPETTRLFVAIGEPVDAVVAGAAAASMDGLAVMASAEDPFSEIQPFLDATDPAEVWLVGRAGHLDTTRLMCDR